METRWPPSPHSVPWAHVANSEPGPPPSLHELPPALWQLFVHTMPGEWGGVGGDAVRPSQSTQSLSYAQIGLPVPKGVPAGGGGGALGTRGQQSTQSVQYAQIGNSKPGALSSSSQSSSETNTQASVQNDGGGGEVAPRKS